MKVKVLVPQSCPPIYNPMDCSPPESSVHAIIQARILEWVAISFSRRSSRFRGGIQASRIAGSSLSSESLVWVSTDTVASVSIKTVRTSVPIIRKVLPIREGRTGKTPCVFGAGSVHKRS